MTSQPDSAAGVDLSAVLAEAQAAAADLHRRGVWSDTETAELDAAFEVAATQALRVPALAERSARLRRLARRYVPESARPYLRRAAAVVDRAARVGFALVEQRLDGGGPR